MRGLFQPEDRFCASFKQPPLWPTFPYIKRYLISFFSRFCLLYGLGIEKFDLNEGRFIFLEKNKIVIFHMNQTEIFLFQVVPLSNLSGKLFFLKGLFVKETNL